MWDLELFYNNCALRDEYGQTLSYGALGAEAEKLYRVVNKRCLVFSLCENSIGSVLGYVSFINSKIVPVLLNAHLEKELLDNLITRYCPEYLWVPKSMRGDFINGKEEYSICGYSLLKMECENTYELNTDLCLLLTTSGSTGSPKFVRQSYQNVESNAKAIVEYLELDETEKPITTLPMNYTYGLSIINSHLLVGATILLTDKGLMQKEFWHFFKEQKATSFGGVPYTYEMLDKLRFFKMSLPSLRYLTQAGGRLSLELHKKFAEHLQENGIKFIVMYGQCEATARMAYLPAEKSLEKCGSMGIAIPGGRFKLTDTDGNIITEPLITGELIYSGSNVMLGYAECGEDLIKGDELNGILHTGDLAKFDNDGYFYIVGRKKRFLKIYGNRVNLDEIDCLIKTEFKNIDCASSGLDDHMYIFVTDGAIANEVRDVVIAKTNLNPSAFQTIVINEIPKNEAGKIMYKDLAKYYE